MTEQNDSLPRPIEELEALAAYYDTHDTSQEMDQGEWVDPRPHLRAGHDGEAHRAPRTRVTPA